MHSKSFFPCIIGAILIVTFLSACTKQETSKYTADWESLDGYPVAEWFDDAKFGIFIHWGGYSEFAHKKNNRGYAEHTPKGIYENPDFYYPYMEKRFGAKPPEFGYKDILTQFKAEKFDPDQWAQLFEDAGARYVVLTAEHHDGFAMWDSDLTEWCATKVGPMRDLVGDLCQAVRERGLKYAPSYHRERHTGFFAVDKMQVSAPPRPDILEEMKRMPEAKGLYGPFSYSDAFIDDYVARWKEIQEKYRPDFMWLDDIPIFYHFPEDPQVKKFKQACAGMIADYLNAAEEWGIDVYLNNKGKNTNWPVDLGCLESDNRQVESIDVKWENPATLATSYGYMAYEEENDLYQSSEKLVHLLCDVVSKNGNLLLNIGPRGDGIIPDGMQDRLLGMGAWLKINGEAIYESRPWNTFGENIVPEESNKDHLGRHNINSTGIRFTRSKDGKHVYAMVLEQADSPVVIESLSGSKVESISLLGSDKKVEWHQTDEGLRVNPPESADILYAAVYKVSLVQ